jgi:hypothetical protein
MDDTLLDQRRSRDDEIIRASVRRLLESERTLRDTADQARLLGYTPDTWLKFSDRIRSAVV